MLHPHLIKHCSRVVTYNRRDCVPSMCSPTIRTRVQILHHGATVGAILYSPSVDEPYNIWRPRWRHFVRSVCWQTSQIWRHCWRHIFWSVSWLCVHARYYYRMKMSSGRILWPEPSSFFTKFCCETALHLHCSIIYKIDQAFFWAPAHHPGYNSAIWSPNVSWGWAQNSQYSQFCNQLET